MTRRHPTLFTLRSGQSGLGFYTTRRDAAIRDADDWPALALGLQLECAIWTENQDFFGTGVATWTSSTVERYLSS